MVAVVATVLVPVLVAASVWLMTLELKFSVDDPLEVVSKTPVTLLDVVAAVNVELVDAGSVTVSVAIVLEPLLVSVDVTLSVDVIVPVIALPAEVVVLLFVLTSVTADW